MFVRDLFHPLDDLAVELFLYCDVSLAGPGPLRASVSLLMESKRRRPFESPRLRLTIVVQGRKLINL
jgi:hypothetical protein